MTFLADDAGIQTSKPVELYEFTDTKGVVFRRTNYQRDVVFLSTYAATAGLKRGQFVIVNSEDVPEMTIELPITDVLVANFAGAGVVPQNWKVKILRLQRTSGETERLWEGFIHSIDLSSEKVAVFTSRALLDAEPGTPIPNIVAQPLCPHTLYDSFCGADRPSNTISPTILTIDGRIIVVSSVAGLSTPAKFGDAFHPASGEWRSIVDQNGTTITLDVPLPSGGPYAAAFGQVLQLSRGCDRRVVTCRNTFSNVANHGGEPQMVRGNAKWPGLMTELKGV